MTSGDRPLPVPPRSRFGSGEGGDATSPLTADLMAQAAATGRLEEFLRQEIPDGEHARTLALMMMGMSGLMPPGAQPPDPERLPQGGEAPTTPEVPAAVYQAVQRGDVAELTGLLRAEHDRRSPSSASSGASASPAPPSGPQIDPAPAGPAIDAAVVNELIRIAADNQVTVDWLMLRAVRFYVEEYRRSGRL